MGANRIHGRTQKIKIAHTGNLDWILKCEEYAFSCADLRRHLTKIASLKAQLISDNVIGIAAGQNLRERTLARTIRSHDRVNLAGANVEFETAKDRLSINGCGQVANAKHYPTLPSRLTPSSLRASTANSIGSSCSTCLQKPLMIVDTASSAESPRC